MAYYTVYFLDGRSVDLKDIPKNAILVERRKIEQVTRGWRKDKITEKYFTTKK